MVGAQEMAFCKGPHESVGGRGHVRIVQGQKRNVQDQNQDRRDDNRTQGGQPVAEQQREKGAHVLILGSSKLWATSTAMLNST